MKLLHCVTALVIGLLLGLLAVDFHPGLASFACDDKAEEVEFFAGQRVDIVGGFYRNQSGRVVSHWKYSDPDGYSVELDVPFDGGGYSDDTVEVDEDDLAPAAVIESKPCKPEGCPHPDPCSCPFAKYE